jgi:anti-sigma B factor antagonist
MDELRINTKFADKNGEIMIVEISGHVDQSNSNIVQKHLNDIVESGVYKVIFDFDKLYYMSSAGWGIFVGEVKRFRDNGGDIKLANMNPDINDVFQMLEFYHILEDFSSVHEAAVSFYEEDDSSDLIIDFEADADPEEETSKPEPPVKPLKSNVIIEDPGKPNVTLIDFKPKKEESNRNEIPLALKQDLRLSELPLSEKVMKIIAESPLLSTFGIRKVLKHQHFGYTNVSIFRLYKLLRDLDLNTKAKRYRYYRSC